MRSAGSVGHGVRAAWRNPAVRLLVGLAISALFLAITLTRVDIRETATALVAASPAGLGLAVALVVVELAIRAERWRVLLTPACTVPRRSTFAYLSIGYFANSMLPARLGDGARAYLAGRSFRISPLVVLGTIIVERVFDAVAIFGVVVVAGLAVAGGAGIAGSAAVLAGAVVLGLASVTGAAVVILRSGIPGVRAAHVIRRLVARLAEGGTALRRPRSLAVVIGLTLVPFAVAICVFGAVAGSLGLRISPAGWAIALGVLALSTALPAAPGSLGTYEFVGVTVLGVLGVAPSQALALTVLVHAVATLPPAIIGLAATLSFHVRITDFEAATQAPLGIVADG